jgi:N-acetylglucosaminyldiphosphoundecaprenol N-acetyl-beta-D-mannosaminyltransferase
MSRKTVRLLDVTIDNVNHTEALHLAESFLREPRLHHIVTPGPEFLLEASAHERFRRILNDADLSLADGFGLHIGARMTGQKLIQRIPGADFVLDLMRIAEQHQQSVFLFGAKHGVADRAAQELLKRFPELNIVGIESGGRGEWTKLEERRLIERIHLAQPTILLVALGAPKQELWINQHRHALHDVRIAMGVGRTFDYLAGTITRAPKLMRSTGLEWLHTYLNAGKYYQPGQRRQRITNATYRFIIEMIQHRRAPRL